MNDLMERFVELGYRYWGDDPAGRDLGGGLAQVRTAIWTELLDIVVRLKALKVPGYYLMANRGRLTRSEMQGLLG